MIDGLIIICVKLYNYKTAIFSLLYFYLYLLLCCLLVLLTHNNY